MNMMCSLSENGLIKPLHNPVRVRTDLLPRPLLPYLTIFASRPFLINIPTPGLTGPPATEGTAHS